MELAEEAHRLAQTDELTGTLNRRGFTTAITQRFSTPDLRGAVAFIDIDDLKTVNDTRGHHAGDRLIQAVVSAISGAVRPGDVIGRLGGDEFAVFAPGADPAGLRDRIAAAVGDSASVGTALLESADGLPAALLAADSAMYDRKVDSRAWRTVRQREREAG